MNTPRVTIVGAGPGDPDLLTLRGLRAIQSADVILYDALVSEEILDFAKSSTLKIFVGKRCGIRSLKQPDINSLITSQAKLNKRVVRLKGGDPFIFGRGWEELSHIVSHGIEVDVVPGISSATALSALQGIPLTNRGTSESFWVLTGTTKEHKLSNDIRLAVQSTATLVILMATRKLSIIEKILIDEGKGSLPFMIVQNGSTPQERVVTGVASNLSKATESMVIGDPGILIIGDVVQLKTTIEEKKFNVEWNA